MTSAQKTARENFKKAIAYRVKTGCSLKQAFAHIKVGKVGSSKKIKRKPSKKTVLKTIKKAVKKSATTKKKSLHYAGKTRGKDGKRAYKYVLSGVKLSNINKQKEEKDLIIQLNTYNGLIRYYENNIQIFKDAIKNHKNNGLTSLNISNLKRDIKKYQELIKEFKTHLVQLKKHI